jgi:hypothetical protein
MGIGMIFMVVGGVEYVDADLKGDCLMMKAAEARRVEVRRVALLGWWERRQESMTRISRNE